MAQYEINEETITVLEIIKGHFSFLHLIERDNDYNQVRYHLEGVIALIRTELQELRKRQKEQEVGKDGQPKVKPL